MRDLDQVRSRLALALAGAATAVVFFALWLLLEVYSKRAEAAPLGAGVVLQVLSLSIWTLRPNTRRMLIVLTGCAEIAIGVGWVVTAPVGSGGPPPPEIAESIGYGQYALFGLGLSGSLMIVAGIIHAPRRQS